MQGYRTYIVSLLMLVLPTLTEWVGGIDWVAVLTNAGVPQALVIPMAGALAAGIMAFMRSITSTAPGAK